MQLIQTCEPGADNERVEVVQRSRAFAGGTYSDIHGALLLTLSKDGGANSSGFPGNAPLSGG